MRVERFEHFTRLPSSLLVTGVTFQTVDQTKLDKAEAKLKQKQEKKLVKDKDAKIRE